MAAPYFLTIIIVSREKNTESEIKGNNPEQLAEKTDGHEKY